MTHRAVTNSDAGALPIFPTNSFVGRQTERAGLIELLRPERNDVVTVTGPGGVGKTRLSLEALRGAEAWSDRQVAIVTLASARRDEELVRAIAQSLEVVDHEENLKRRIVESLQSRPHLLLLDNLEHVIDGSRELVQWLISVAPDIRILTTSRIAIGLPDEVTFELGPLSSESLGESDDLFRLDSVQLFLDRARDSNPRMLLHDGDLERITELCRRYDGLPLAIELIASWANVLTPREMLDRHDIRLEDRVAGREHRHHSLDDAIRWSYELLSDSEQAFFLRMSLFPGGFSRDLADGMVRGTSSGAALPRAVGYDHPWGSELAPTLEQRPNPYETHSPALLYAAAPLNLDSARAIATLLDHHLILPAEDVDGVLCFDMLETIREFGRNELSLRGELDAALQNHATTMVAFAEASSDYLWNSCEPRWGVERVMAAMPSLRAALHWLDDQGEAGQELIVRIAGPLWIVYQTRGLISEGRRWLESGMLLPERLDWLRCIELPPLAFLSWIQNDDQRADIVLDEFFAASERWGNPASVGLAHLVRALVLYRQPEPDLIRLLKHVDKAEASFLEWEVPHGIVGCRSIYGIVARMLGDLQQALELFEEAHRIAIESSYAWGIAITRYFAGETLREVSAGDESRLPEAISMMTEALSQTWEQGDAWSAGGALSGLACIRVQRGELIEAARMFGAAGTLMQRVGASLLSADLLTHTDVSEGLRSRVGDEIYDRYVTQGAHDPESVVEETIKEFGRLIEGERDLRSTKLTTRQMAILRDLAMGLDPPAIAIRRGRSISATYEIIDRIRERLDVDTWEQIIPRAIERGLLEARF